MSKTMMVRVVGPSHWRHMALVMARFFQKAGETGDLRKDDIPPNVYLQALQFVNLYLEGLKRDSSNLPAALNVLEIAHRAASCVPGQNMLFYGCRLIKGMEHYQAYPCLKTMSYMASFFSELHKMGETEAYERVMGEGGEDDE